MSCEATSRTCRRLCPEQVDPVLAVDLPDLDRDSISDVHDFFTVLLSVLIFSFFYLTYANAIQVGAGMGNDLRLVVYLNEDPPPALQEEYRHRIEQFDAVDRIEFVSSDEALQRFSKQLGSDSDVYSDRKSVV